MLGWMLSEKFSADLSEWINTHKVAHICVANWMGARLFSTENWENMLQLALVHCAYDETFAEWNLYARKSNTKQLDQKHENKQLKR